MKKALFLGVVASAIGLYACKKDGTTTTITNTVRDTTIINQFASGVVNADTLMSGIKVAHGASVSSEFPASSTAAAAPELDTLYKKTYTVVQSRFLAIYPPVVSGNISGYYVQIAGAKSHFKVDYTQAYGWRKRVTPDGRESAEGYIDSSIVIKLPTTIKGDTFYVKYAAYDDQNRVSKAITATVLVLPEADDEFTSKATGKWQYYSTNYVKDNVWSYENYLVDTGGISTAHFTCNNNLLNANPDGELEVTSQNTTRYRLFTIGKYSYTDEQYYKSLTLDITSSTCSDYVYTKYENTSLRTSGGYSYDPESKRVTFVVEESGMTRSGDQSNINLYTETYKLVEITATYLVLAETAIHNDDYNYGLQYFRYNKQ
jgi:hypothetical protein